MEASGSDASKTLLRDRLALKFSLHLEKDTTDEILDTNVV